MDIRRFFAAVCALAVCGAFSGCEDGKATVSGTEQTAQSTQQAAQPLKTAPGGAQITEVCPKNGTYKAADGLCYDYIELYNPGGTAADISGWGLSDKDDKPYRYKFPEDTVIEAGEYLMVFCGKDIPDKAGEYTASFGISAKGETLWLTDAQGNAVQEVTFGPAPDGKAYSLLEDGTFDFADPTPGEQSILAEGTPAQAEELSAPVFETPGGFYDKEFECAIAAPEGLTVRYTLDGSEPAADSTVYSSPIKVRDISPRENVFAAFRDITPGGATPPKAKDVAKATVVRAAAFDEKGNRSGISTAVYFVGYNKKADYYNNYRVISIVTDSRNLFNYETGIYTTGKTLDEFTKEHKGEKLEGWQMDGNYSNRGREWERPVTLQIFEDGKQVFSQDMGIRIHGGASRASEQKSLNVYARSDYDSAAEKGAHGFEFDFFDGSLKAENGDTIDGFDSFVLRNGGNDSQYFRFRDTIIQRLVSDREILTQGARTCILFINGEFWGQYEFTEKLSQRFVADHYGLDKKNVAIIKNDSLEDGTDADYEDFTDLWHFIQDNDLSSDTNYDKLCEMVDMKAFIDYAAAELYIYNWDWGDNNVAMWKCTAPDDSNPYADGRWRFAMFDTEYSTGLYGQCKANVDSFKELAKKQGFIPELFFACMKNEGFKRDFVTVFMDLANGNFSYKPIEDMAVEYMERDAQLVADTFNRFWPWWPGGDRAAEQFYNEGMSMLTFFEKRREYAAGHIAENFGLSSPVSVTIKDTRGKTVINTIAPAFDEGIWEGLYFPEYSIHLENSEANFSHFAIDGKPIDAKSLDLSKYGDGVVIEARYS